MKDSERSSVLAHERFVAARSEYEGLGLAERFERIERTNLWGAASSVSGLGSEQDATAAVRAALPGLLARLEIHSMLDAPCGDARWIVSADLDVDYIGVDIVPALVRSNAIAWAGERRRFLRADLTCDPLPRADLILCRDCLVHLSFRNIAKVLSTFRASGATWLLATTFPLWNANQDCEDGDWRALNMQRPPFSWPQPAALIDERCGEGCGTWRDKSLGLWPVAGIPM